MKDEFILMADLPPTPLDTDEIERYKKLGFNTFILTEDDVKFTKNGKITDEYIKAINNISNVGLNIFIRNMYNDPDYFNNSDIKYGSNYGAKYTIEKRHITDEFKAFPLVTGFYMADEPYMYSLKEHGFSFPYKRSDYELYSDFSCLKRLVEWKNSNYENLYFHMNMVPSSSYDHYYPIGTKIFGYNDFIEEYVKVIASNLSGGECSLCLDNYPFIGENYIEPDYLYDLLIVSRIKQKYDGKLNAKLRFGLCVQTFEAKSANGDGRIRDIESVQEVTFQLYTGLALGATLFEYFCYLSYMDEMRGILSKDGSGRLYSIVEKANDIFTGVLNTLDGFIWQGAIVSSGKLECDNAKAFIKVRDLLSSDTGMLEKIESNYDVLVGYYKNDDYDLYVVVNYTDPKKQRITGVHMAFKDKGQLMLRLNPGEGKIIKREK